MRQPLTDGQGRWFDTSTATRFEEATRFDGSNHISVATGSQWAHEELYRTAGGRWILHSWSQWQGTQEHWELIEADQAAEWLILCGHDVPADLAGAADSLEVR